jgi:hypothetical protein
MTCRQEFARIKCLLLLLCSYDISMTSGLLFYPFFCHSMSMTNNSYSHGISFWVILLFLQAGPPKYLSITTYERCSAEQLRDFYMDNEYRMEWDNTVKKHEQLQYDENSGVEVGRTIKKFPLLTPREYILAWRVWEANDKSFYCFIKVTLPSFNFTYYCA